MQDAIATATAARSTKPACRTQKTTVRSIARVSITVVDVYASRPKAHVVRSGWHAPFRSPEPLAQRPLRPPVPGTGPIPCLVLSASGMRRPTLLELSGMELHEVAHARRRFAGELAHGVRH